MRGLAEICVFTGLAAAVHAAVIVTVVSPAGLPDGAGASGDAVLTLAAVSPELAATVQGWTRPPEVMERLVAAPREPDLETLSVQASEDTLPRSASLEAGRIAVPTLPDPAIALDEVPAAPAPDARITPIAPETVVLSSPRPAPRPSAARPPAPLPPVTASEPVAPQQLSEPPRAAQQAKGPGAAASKGASTASVQSVAARVAPSASSIAAWGADIRARIEARKMLPAGRWAPRRVVLRITVGRDGRVQGAAILQSAGDARLDRAALAAVTRAGRLPKAPAGFDRDTMQFDLPISFTR
jgi:protein TonB